jgi:hypothetical protein
MSPVSPVALGVEPADDDAGVAGDEVDVGKGVSAWVVVAMMVLDE